VDLARMRGRLAAVGEFAIADGLLVGAVAGGLGLTVFPDGRAIVRGTVDAAAAQSLYDRCVGG
jgi:adenylyltransferase/sulfurtransferase